MTVADSTTKDFWWKFGKDAKIDQSQMMSPYSRLPSNQSDNSRGNLLDEFIRFGQKILQVKMIGNQLFNYSIPFNLPIVYAPMNIPKVVGFRADLCDTCSFQTIDPVFSFDRLDSAVKTRHNCNSQTQSMLQSRRDISDSRTKSHESIISILTQLITDSVGSQPIFLTAEELLAPHVCMTFSQHIIRKMPILFLSMLFSKQRTFIDLGGVSNDHWAHRAISGQDRKTILKMEELLEFLKLTKSSFGAFQVELQDGMRHYLRLYINLP